MPTSVTLPALGESVTEGTVTKWLKAVGDTVAVDEPLLEVSTDKVDTEIPSPASGVILEISAIEDAVVAVGAQLCVIGDVGAAPVAAATTSPSHVAAPVNLNSENVSLNAAMGYVAPPESQPVVAPPAVAPKHSAVVGDTTIAANEFLVTLPVLGESITEAIVTNILKQPGESVAVDEALLEVSTDKVDTEIPSPKAGIVSRYLVTVDSEVGVGGGLVVLSTDATNAVQASTDRIEAPVSANPIEAQVLANLNSEDGKAEDLTVAIPRSALPTEAIAAPAIPAVEAASAVSDASAVSTTPLPDAGETVTAANNITSEATAAPAVATQVTPENPTPEAVTATKIAPPADSSTADSAYVTPLVRKLATEKGVDLAKIVGTGVSGRIRKQDVIAAAEASQPAQPATSPIAASVPSSTTSPLRGKTEPMTRLRKVIAERMVNSLQTSAQLTTVVEVDVTGISRTRDRLKDEFFAREGVKLSFMPFFAKAAIDALKAHPVINATVNQDKGEITYFDTEDVAIAVDTERGLLTPVIKNAGELSVSGLAKKITDLANRTRDNQITPDDLMGGTFTITNTGSRGALFDTPIINQPQVAILGTGTVVKRPVVIDDPNLGETIAVRQMVYLALTYDHRIVDGADAARFLTDLKNRLEQGNFTL